MKFHRSLSAFALAAAALASAPSQAADYAHSFQGVTFEFSVLDSNTFNLTMLNTNAASGDWAGVTRLNAFMLKDIGTGFTGATATGSGSFTYNSRELNANGCAGGPPGGNSKNLCFSGLAAVGPSLSWNVDVTGANLAIDSLGPHLKLRFGNGTDSKVGSLLSQNLPAVPEPETYALMLAGLAAVAFVARRSRAA